MLGNENEDADKTKEGDPSLKGSTDKSNPHKDRNKAQVPNLERKIGLVTFIQGCEPKPNKYVEAMLRSNHMMDAYTKAQWEQIVGDLLNKKVK